VSPVKLPPDRGLPGLGLLMQVLGSFFAVMSATVAIPQIISLVRMVDLGVTPEGWLVAMPVLLLVGAVRSLFHRRAGVALSARRPPLRAILPYLVASAVHTVGFAVVLIGVFGVPLAAALPLVLLFAAWPVTLAIMLAQPGLQPVAGAPGENGVDGLAVMMLVLGVGGALFLLFAIVMMVFTVREAAGPADPGGLAVAFLFLALLAARSAVHVHASVTMLRRPTVGAVDQVTGRYALTAVGSTVLICMLSLAFSEPDAEELPILLAMLAILGLLFVAWPIAVRHHLRPRSWIPAGAAADTPVLPAADRGLSTLGWLHLGSGVFALAMTVPGALFAGSIAESMETVELTGYLSMMQPRSPMSPWLAVAGSALQAWAGVELVLMTRRYKWVALAYALSAIVLAVVSVFAVIDMLESMAAQGGQTMATGPIVFGTLAFSLVVPVITVILVVRRLPTPVQPTEVFD
jgi:hypothetical protein